MVWLADTFRLGCPGVSGASPVDNIALAALARLLRHRQSEPPAAGAVGLKREFLAHDRVTREELPMNRCTMVALLAVSSAFAPCARAAGQSCQQLAQLAL